jgi:uncharacterized protein YodC (DUF2158 family)
MTVSQYSDVGVTVDAANVQCQWFSGSKHQQAWFPEGALELAKD